jgi:hypothetical protein
MSTAEFPMPSDDTVETKPIGFVTHYGLFWYESDVLWKQRGSAKKALLGREKSKLERRGAPTAQERSNAKDYAEFVGLYCLYRNGHLIYVGEAGLANQSNLFGRINAHRSDHLSDLWDQFSWFGCERAHLGAANVTAKLGLQQMEAVAIAIINPGNNKQSGTFAGAMQVFQVPNEAADGDVNTNLERILQELEELKSRLPKK